MKAFVAGLHDIITDSHEATLKNISSFKMADRTKRLSQLFGPAEVLLHYYVFIIPNQI